MAGAELGEAAVPRMEGYGSTRLYVGSVCAGTPGKFVHECSLVVEAQSLQGGLEALRVYSWPPEAPLRDAEVQDQALRGLLHLQSLLLKAQHHCRACHC